MRDKNTIRIDEETFVKAYEACWKALYMTCCKYVNDTEAAQEIVQDLFISIWERRAVIEIQTSLKQYLFSALKLKIFEYYRKQSVRNNYLQQTPFPEGKHLTEEAVLYKDLQQALGLAIASLPDRCQQVYRLSREKGMDNKSIAAALVITEKAVEGNITRALSYIKKRLKRFRE
ncbi:RNA polymerase sigma-70 factor [Chitinophaga nivalis]|uniref:RNA polymerase sigma-70 factor n=1 Tax=Chitinophaga nivalis TaxID=2991709 RepID=A0ABT3IHL1_9BACT|nr:RNA polymerase sigma-70 factor [Chitinophaga nivalis]MCW3467060.1 RNA polymerase sigma-70 factor [Chitinophaga nivalis]MCW3483249.1 RNA polymerase sigma-70 factor [Chitinophaga nivalis]